MNFHSQRFGRAAETYNANAQVQKKMGDILLGLLPEIAGDKNRSHLRIMEMGCGTGLFTEKILRRFPSSDCWITDASEKMLEVAQKHIQGEISSAQLEHRGNAIFSLLDARGKVEKNNEVNNSELKDKEAKNEKAKKIKWVASEVESSAHYDLAASNALVQWFPDLGQHLQMVASLLSPQGLYLVSGFTRGNFPELNSLLQEPPFNYAEFPGHLQEEVSLAASQNGFKVESWHTEPIEMIYPSPESFLAVLRGLGSSRHPDSVPLTQSRLVYLVEQYRARYSCLGGVRATWVPWFALLRKHQPQ
jgi:malonyl-CoA O-methyltransferase